MGDRGPLATAVSGQSNQLRHDHWERSSADEESGQYCPQDGGHHATEKQHLLGAQFRRFRTKLGSPIAISAMAAKLARFVYRMLRHGMKIHVDQGAKFYETQHRILQIKQLKWKADNLVFQVVQALAA